MLREKTLLTSNRTDTIPGIRIPPRRNILEERFLHKLFLLLHRPAAWSKGQLGISLLLLAFLVELIWLPSGRVTFVATAIYLLFAISDWLLLAWLPRAGFSFGPPGPQLLLMTFPRLGVAVGSGLLAYLAGSGPGLIALIAGQGLGTLIYLWGFLREPFALEITPMSLQLAGWPADAPPLRLLHLSDLHVERITQREQDLLRYIEQLQPDLIVITGDYLNLSYVDEPLARAEVRKLLAQLSAPYGIYATLGSPPADPRDTTPTLFKGLNIRLLRDEAVTLDLGQGRRLSLLGLDCEHDLNSDASALDHLIDLTPADVPRLLLYHSPELMPQAQQYPIDLYLCGHTHGGQVRFPFYGALLTSSQLGQRYVMGLYREQGTTLYISRGIGLEGLCAPRMRLLCPPEAIVWTLGGEA